MNKFEQERIYKVNLDTTKFKHPIPIVWISPKIKQDDSCVFIFDCGLGGTNSFNVYMNNPVYDHHYFVMYDKMSHGENKNKASQFKKKYLTELDLVVDWAKQQFPNKKIFLLGESWGCAVNFIYYQKYTNKISGVINWNMPTKPISPVKKTFKENFQYAWKEIFTFITNIDLTLIQSTKQNECLTRNQLLVRAMALRATERSSTRLTLAVWRYMRPSYKFLLKNCANPKYNFLYVQSGQDALMTKKHIDDIEKRADASHYLKIPTGYHILTMEQDESIILYNAVQEFIKK